MPERRSLTSMIRRGDGEIEPKQLLDRMDEDEKTGVMAPDDQPPRPRYKYDEGADRYERWLNRCLDGG